jgi:hypothetical protein
MSAETNIIIGPVQVSFFHGWEAKAPKGSTKAVYSTQLVFDADNKKIKDKIDMAIEAAKEEGKAKLDGVKPSKMRLPLYVGEEEFPGEDFYKGKLYLNASNTRQPGIGKKVKGKVEPIVDEEEVYSGCWVYAEINFFAYNNVGAGIGCSLQNILKHKDGPNLGTIKRSIEETFGSVDFEDTEEDDATPASIRAGSNGMKESKKSDKEETTAKAGKKGNPFADDDENEGSNKTGKGSKKPNPFDD